MTIRFFSRNRSVNRIGYGVSASTPISTNASGFSPSPNPQGGTNHCIVGPAPGSITFSVGAASPPTISYLPSKNKQIRLQTYSSLLLADVFLVGGGGYGGNAGDLGNSGGGGGGGVVYQPGINLDITSTYYVSTGAADVNTTFGPGTPAYLVAIRGGGGGNRGGTGQPGGSGGGYWTPGPDTVGTGYQASYPNPFGTPQNSNTYGYGNPGSGLSGGSSPFSVPSSILSGTPVAPLGPGGFGRGQGITNITGNNGSGTGGSGSQPPGATYITPGAPGCAIIRIYPA